MVAGDPHPPQTQRELRPPAHAVGLRARRWWTARAWLIASGPLLTAGALLASCLLFFPGALPWLAPLTALVLALPALGYALAMPARRHRVHAWELGESAVRADSGWLWRRRRMVPLSRVRSAAVRRGPLQRRFGLATVTVGTGSAAGDLRIAGLDEDVARELAGHLDAVARPQPEHPAATDAGGPRGPVLAVGRAAWLRYAPLTFWVIGGVLVVAGTVWRVLTALRIKPWRIGWVHDAAEEFGHSVLWLTVPLALLAVTALGAVGAVLVTAEGWWRFRLEWAGPSTLTVRRGLLTNRTVTIERDRLCGVALREPLLLRAGGGASVRAVAGGLGNRDENRRRSVVLPPAPRAVATGVCAGLLGAGAGTERELRPHPRAALRRRVAWAIGWGVLPVTAALAVLGWLLTPVLLFCAAGWTLLAVPVARALARDAHRSLGHALHGRHLVVRSGTFGRETVTLDRDAVLAWTFTDTPFSRRAGVVTVTAAVPGGEDGYRIRDMSAAGAAGFAESAAPGIVREWLAPAVR
ncbi:PH domain-containing protein [Streptomyces cinnamoneus]|uniref:PH domain-containing protein n=1 Tax=Streptomyces cinnamoneus TaxID=53446 RepID=UPI0033D00E82